MRGEREGEKELDESRGDALAFTEDGQLADNPGLPTTAIENREFAQGDLGGRKTGYFRLTEKSWTPRWTARPGRV